MGAINEIFGIKVKKRNGQNLLLYIFFGGNLYHQTGDV